MREFIEFRISESDASEHLGEVGWRMGDDGLVRCVRLPMEDERVRLIGELNSEFHRAGGSFFRGWDITRHYTPEEIQSAEIFELSLRSVFEPCGEMCGTKYDESSACPHCGAGARQSTDLRLEPETIPRRNMHRTIAGEIIMSSRLVQAFQAHGITGASFLAVRDTSGRVLENWHQLVVTSAPVDIVPPTQAGNGPFDLDTNGEYRCPQGHVLGLNRISELWLKKDSHDGSDLARTRQLFGARMGVLHPHPEYLISPRLFRLLRELKVGRLIAEVAHWG
ncbi:hypothetical protein ACN28I_20290 [Archangium gephyra]|uniref:hypothetical protein n=1 Tax=Archangium gephyra TaxID=48 RepID=UPI003B7C207A